MFFSTTFQVAESLSDFHGLLYVGVGRFFTVFLHFSLSGSPDVAAMCFDCPPGGVLGEPLIW